MTTPTRIQGLPDLIYGTAFKFDRSAELVESALTIGFRALDTASSKHAYREKLVGDGLAAAIFAGKVKREELYIQTKFSPFKAGRKPELYPYDTTKPIPTQVAESVASSLANLGVDYIDCLVLHSLYPDINDTLTAWRAMEALVPTTVSSLGISDCDADTLRLICSTATIKPCAVQNRFSPLTVTDTPDPTIPKDLPYPRMKFDIDVRKVCLEEGVGYAPWGVLWGCLDVLDGENGVFGRVGEEIGVAREIVCYAVLRSLEGCKISILCGTTREAMMRETVEGLENVRRWIEESDENRETWRGVVEAVKRVVNGSEIL